MEAGKFSADERALKGEIWVGGRAGE